MKGVEGNRGLKLGGRGLMCIMDRCKWDDG